MITLVNLWKKLRKRKYRKAFAASQLKRGVPFQIRALRKARGWSQQELANRSGLPQGTISRAENLNYGDLSFNTVIQIANGFDVAFVGRFVPFSELSRWYVALSDSIRIETFEEEYSELGDAGPGEDAGSLASPQSIAERAPAIVADGPTADNKLQEQQLPSGGMRPSYKISHDSTDDQQQRYIPKAA